MITYNCTSHSLSIKSRQLSSFKWTTESWANVHGGNCDQINRQMKNGKKTEYRDIIWS